MQVFGVLAGLLLLFVSTHGHNNLQVACTDLFLEVRIKRVSYVDQLTPEHYEFYLGTGCPVTRVLPDFFEFAYTITFCGIKKYDYPWGSLIESSVTYEPMFSNVRGHTIVACAIQREFSFTFSKKIVKNRGGSGKITQKLLEKTNSTSSEVDKLGVHPGMLCGSSFPLDGLQLPVTWKN